MEHCHRKYPLNFDVDLTQNRRMTAILDFRYSVTQFLFSSIGGVSVVGLGEVCALLSDSSSFLCLFRRLCL